jgi:hypothetical protein
MLATVKDELGEEQYEAYLALVRACGSLWQKSHSQVDLATALRATIEATIAVEAHLPVTEPDIKLHEIAHLPGSIYRFGPGWTLAMWCYEGLWPSIMKWATNRAHPEVRSKADSWVVG